MTCHRPYYNRGGTLTEKDFLKIGKEVASAFYTENVNRINITQKPKEEGMIKYSGFVTTSPAAFSNGCTS